MTKTAVADAHRIGLVLAIHPTSKGFGWVLFENLHSPVAWAVVRAGANGTPWLLDRLKHLFNRYQPAVFVLENYEERKYPRAARNRKLCRAMCAEARRRKIEIRIYTREAVCNAFSRFGATTRSEIARVVADRITDISHRLPPPPRTGYSTDPRQSLFDAAALAVTYFVAMGDEDWPN